MEPEIKKQFGTDLKVKSGKGKWDAEDQLRQAVWRRLEADKKRSRPVKQHDDADSDEEAVQGGDENDGDADADDADDDAAGAAAVGDAAAADGDDDDTARKGDVEAGSNDDVDPESAPKDFNYPQAACATPARGLTQAPPAERKERRTAPAPRFVHHRRQDSRLRKLR